MEAPDEFVVELTGPDGESISFRFGGVVPHDGTDYVVLCELTPDENGEEQLLITHLEREADGHWGYVVEQDPAIVQAVFDKYCQAQTRDILDQPEDEES